MALYSHLYGLEPTVREHVIVVDRRDKIEAAVAVLYELAMAEAWGGRCSRGGAVLSRIVGLLPLYRCEYGYRNKPHAGILELPGRMERTSAAHRQLLVAKGLHPRRVHTGGEGAQIPGLPTVSRMLCLPVELRRQIVLLIAPDRGFAQ